LNEISISVLSEKQSTNFDITNDNTDSQYALYVGMSRDIKNGAKDIESNLYKNQ